MKPLSEMFTLDRGIRCQGYLRLSGHMISADTILYKRKLEGSWAKVDYTDSWDNLSTRTKSFRYKHSTLDSGFIRVRIRDISGKFFLNRTDILFVRTKTNPVLKLFAFSRFFRLLFYSVKVVLAHITKGYSAFRTL